MILDTAILGALQGILEWLPISSQGILMLVMIFIFGFDQKQALSLSVFLHIGSMLSVIVYFRNNIFNIMKDVPHFFLKKPLKNEGSLISFFIISTGITGIVGYPVFIVVEASTSLDEFFIILIGLALIVTGLVKRLRGKTKERQIADLNSVDALILGLLQGLSVIPGFSRSGITTTGLLFRGFDGKIALELSFLMSIPVVLAAEIGLGIIKGFTGIGLLEMVLGCFFAFVMGIFTIHSLLRISQKTSLSLFCIILGSLALISILPII